MNNIVQIEKAKMRLKVLYQQMSELTQPKCATCRAPNTCCAPEHCHTTKELALEEWGVNLPTTHHPKLPFMGSTGCTVPPHLRAICTVYVCEQHYMKDLDFSDKYFDLRDKIGEVSIEAGLL